MHNIHTFVDASQFHWESDIAWYKNVAIYRDGTGLHHAEILLKGTPLHAQGQTLTGAVTALMIQHKAMIYQFQQFHMELEALTSSLHLPGASKLSDTGTI